MLAEYEGAIRVVLTLAYFVVTLVMVATTLRNVELARHTLDEMRMARDDEMRADCWFDLVFREREVYAVVANQGRLIARKIRVSLDQNPKIRTGYTRVGSDEPEHISDLAVVTAPLEMLGPGARHEEYLGESFRFFQDNELRELTGTLTYSDERGREHTFPIRIDLRPYADREFMAETTVEDLIQPLEKFQRYLVSTQHNHRR